MKMAGLLAAVVSLSVTGCIMVAPIATPVEPPLSTRDEVRALVELINDHRRALGCGPLVWVSQVAAVAQQHSQNMVDHDFFSHTDHEGKTPFTRLRDAGITYRSAAENIAYGQRTADQVLRSWLSSSGHKRNIEDCGFEQHGIGLTGSRWTHVFVTMR